MIPFLIIFLIIVILSVIYVFLVMPRVTDTADMDMLSIDYAHRGLHNASAPENSMAAFRAAIKEGYGIELDVQLSSDGEIFVFHDETLERLCGIKKTFSSLSSVEIKNLRIRGSAEHIPTLDEVLELVEGEVPLLIEVKFYSEHEKLCAALAEKLDAYMGAFAIQSFNPRVLAYFKKYRPRFARGQLVCKLGGRSKGAKKSKPTATPKKLNPFLSFALSNMLTNVISRPDFISIEGHHTKNPAFILATEVFKAKGFIWTVRTEKQYSFCKKQGFFAIFERIDPQ